MTRIYALFGDRATGIDRSISGLGQHSVFSGPVIYLDQTHSTHVVTIDDPDNLPVITADAVVTALPNVALAIKTADCAAILLSDATAGIIGAVHSGWMGTLHNIIQPTVAVMREKSALPSRIKAVIGPCLQKHNFQIGNEIFQDFMNTNSRYEAFFSPAGQDVGKYQFDNVGLITWQLQQCGVTDIIADSLCTLDNTQNYYSYRARHADKVNNTMRNVSLIWQKD